MQDQGDDPIDRDLYDAILLLQDPDECRHFFEDLCTAQEVEAMRQRFEVAKALAGGKKYSEIAEETGASTATISRVRRSLSYGSKGYSVIIDRMKGSD